MKKIFILLLISISLKGFSQTDSSAITQTISLQQKYQLYIIGFIDKGNTDKINYIIQVKKQYNANTDTANVTVTIPSSLILEVYSLMTAQPEGVTSDYNNAIKNALVPQITNGWLMSQLGAIMQKNVSVRTGIIERSRALILALSL